MALLEVKTSYATYTDCTLRVGQYQMDGSIAAEIFSRREGPVARITVSMTQGVLVAGLSTYVNQLIKQLEKDE